MLTRDPAHVMVLLDQAYLEFVDDAGTSSQQSLDFLAAHPTLVLLHTFSRVYCLAGLRVGHLLAHPGIAAAVRAVAPPFGLNKVAEAAAVAALKAACLSECVSVRSFAGEGVRVTLGCRDAESAVLRRVDAWLGSLAMTTSAAGTQPP